MKLGVNNDILKLMQGLIEQIKKDGSYMKKLEMSSKRRMLFENIFLSNDANETEEVSFLEKLIYPEDYDGKRIYKNFYKYHGEKFTDIEKVISFLIIWCTGDTYWEEYEIESPDELHEGADRNLFGNVSYADIVIFEGKKTIVFYEIYG